MLHNYRLLICDRRPHSRNDRSETSIYYGGFGLIFLQLFKTPTTVRGLKTFPLLGCGGGSRRRLRILVSATLQLDESISFQPEPKLHPHPHCLMHMSISIHRGYQTHFRPQRGNRRIFQSVHWASFMKHKRNWFLCVWEIEIYLYLYIFRKSILT